MNSLGNVAASSTEPEIQFLHGIFSRGFLGTKSSLLMRPSFCLVLPLFFKNEMFIMNRLEFPC
jgi:hypothetical protein